MAAFDEILSKGVLWTNLALFVRGRVSYMTEVENPRGSILQDGTQKKRG